MPAFLIVDEDRNFRRALVVGLRLDGHFAFSVGDADEARTRLAACWFDCCLVDAHLPGADALLEFAAAAGTRTFATGPYPELLHAAARRHPRAEPLAKPFLAADLVARLGRTASAA